MEVQEEEQEAEEAASKQAQSVLEIHSKLIREILREIEKASAPDSPTAIHRALNQMRESRSGFAKIGRFLYGIFRVVSDPVERTSRDGQRRYHLVRISTSVQGEPMVADLRIFPDRDGSDRMLKLVEEARNARDRVRSYVFVVGTYRETTSGRLVINAYNIYRLQDIDEILREFENP